jgi:NAD(P)-dependent dehydrogenase (short-subunit alcohol dehydrogenase family)
MASQKPGKDGCIIWKPEPASLTREPTMRRVAIVTGGLRGLGRAMSLGLAQDGFLVVAVGHLTEDVPAFMADAAAFADRALALVADLRRPDQCDRVVDAVRQKFGDADVLVNNAGLTFTYISPDRFRRPEPQKFWEISDEIVQSVMDTNYVAADQLARRLAPRMVAAGWGRIVNVTTKLDTMNRAGNSPYGPSKAALEMATEIWAKEVEGSGLTVNILNPGAGANTPGMAAEMRAASREGRVTRLVEPDQMVPPLRWLVSSAADAVNGMRFDANLWNPEIDPAEAAKAAGRPAGFQLHAG